MSGSWKQYEGQVINNTFLLRRYLGGSSASAVFLTELARNESGKAAIKFIPEGHGSDLQLSLWRRAAQLTHPNLLKVYQSGRCHLVDMDLLYVAMEFAEEDLSQIVPERSLTSAEVRDMLTPVLSALHYLHQHGLIHSHIKPSNVLATGDQLKLSSDTLFPVGELRKGSGTSASDIYRAPEAPSSPCSPAADVWSLGMTVVETLTQHAPTWERSRPADPDVPETLPQPFLDIARHTLLWDPKHRWTMAEIGACLNPVAVAAAAAQSASPLAIPLSSVPAVPAAKLQSTRQASPSTIVQTPVPQHTTAPKKTIFLPNYVLPVAAGVVVLAGIITLPRILGRRAETPSSDSSTPASSPEDRGQIASAAKAGNSPASKPVKPGTRSETKPARIGDSSAETAKAQAPTAAPASLRTETTANVETPKSSAGGGAHGEVLDQVLPQVPEKAQATIQGTVRVTVLLHVDAAGNVSDASLDSPGPSQYFADLALKAARRWEFTSPEVDGHSVPSEWRVRFEFSQSGVKTFPIQSTP